MIMVTVLCMCGYSRAHDNLRIQHKEFSLVFICYMFKYCGGWGAVPQMVIIFKFPYFQMKGILISTFLYAALNSKTIRICAFKKVNFSKSLIKHWNFNLSGHPFAKPHAFLISYQSAYYKPITLPTFKQFSTVKGSFLA